MEFVAETNSWPTMWGCRVRKHFSIATAAMVLMATFSAHAAPIYQNSVVSNDLDFIRSDDPGVFACLMYEGRFRAEMPDKRRNKLFSNDVYTYTALFEDGTAVGIWVHPDVGSQDAARTLALLTANPVGKLPTIMRSRLDHVVIHSGNETAFSEDRGRFFVLYSQNMANRIRNHDLEETVFHESVHATLDYPKLTSSEWTNAQRADGDFITTYAKRKPRKEDMAESALFAWALLIHPGRLPKNVERQLRSIMPSRLAFFEDIFVNSGPIFRKTGSAGSKSKACPGAVRSEPHSSPKISKLQRDLMRHCSNLPTDFADGKFGPATRATLRRLQESYGLTPDGVYGPRSSVTLDGPVTGACK